MSKHIISIAVLAVAATVAVPAFGQQTSTGPSWQALRSTVNRSVDVEDSFNPQFHRTTTTNTDASRRTDVDVDADIDASRNADGSFNRSVDASRNADGSFNTDASRNADGSFNTDNSRRTELDLQAQIDASRNADGSFNTDNSREANDSFNRDLSRRAYDSFNTDKSISDSYNSTWQKSIDLQKVSPTVTTHKNVTTADTQDQNQNGVMYGPQQSGSQGGFSMGSLINEAPRSTGYGGGYHFKSPTTIAPSYRLKQSNSTLVEGSNNGVIHNENTANQGSGELIRGHKGSVVNSRLGNEQSFYAGDMQQLQNAEQQKRSSTSGSASDTVVTNASK